MIKLLFRFINYWCGKRVKCNRRLFDFGDKSYLRGWEMKLEELRIFILERCGGDEKKADEIMEAWYNFIAERFIVEGNKVVDTELREVPEKSIILP